MRETFFHGGYWILSCVTLSIRWSIWSRTQCHFETFIDCFSLSYVNHDFSDCLSRVQAYFSTKNIESPIHPSSHLLLSSKSMMNVFRSYIISPHLTAIPEYPGCTGCGLVANVFKLAALFCLPRVLRSLIWGVQPRDTEETDPIHTLTVNLTVFLSLVTIKRAVMVKVDTFTQNVDISSEMFPFRL